MFPQIKTILYTTALSSYTRPVLRFAVALARQHKASIVLLHVVEPLNSSVKFLMENYLSPEKAAELHHEATNGILENSISDWKHSARRNSDRHWSKPSLFRKFASSVVFPTKSFCTRQIAVTLT